MSEIEDVLSFWFGELDADGRADREHVTRWFKKDDAFDKEIRDRFLETRARVVAGGGAGWLDSPRGRLACVIVLDQLSRNMFRGTARMFEADAQALAVASSAVDAGEDRALGVQERTFLYMPFMHSESLADQERCVRLFEGLRDELTSPRRDEVSTNVDYAIRHRDIVARFGRFPHRNTILGRPSTAEEVEFLKQPGSSF